MSRLQVQFSVTSPCFTSWYPANHVLHRSQNDLSSAQITVSCFPILNSPLQTENLFNVLPGPPCLYDLLPALLPALVYYHLCASLHYPFCFSGPLYYFSLWEMIFFFPVKDVFLVFFLENSLHRFFTWLSPCNTSERSNISCRGIYFSTSFAKNYL